MTVYPEHDKLSKVQAESQAIGEFLDLGPYHLCEVVDRISPYSGRIVGEDLVPTSKPIQTILAEWFGIDQAKLEREKRAMLDALRPQPVRPVTRGVEWPTEWRR